MQARVRSKTMPANSIYIEVLTRISLFLFNVWASGVPAFERKIHPEEAWLYKNPMTPSYVSVYQLFALALIIPSCCFIFYGQQQKFRQRSDLCAAILGLTLSIALTGALTNVIKIAVGRPRPDFLSRCFPSGEIDLSKECSGRAEIVTEGRKSFPSGHSSIIFSSMNFLSLYLIAKMQLLSSAQARQDSLRMLLAASPLLLATLVAISRTCDYHHHWQDVTVGSLIGIAISYICYRQLYPSLSDSDAAFPEVEYPVYEGELIEGVDGRTQKLNVKNI